MQIHIFPGQGAQFKGMGADLFADFRTLTDKASSILGYDLADLCLNDPDGNLVKTQYTQPALLTVCFLEWIKHFEETDCQPDMLAGHSLGEITALCVADVFNFDGALKLVKHRGELMSLAKGGGMLAVIGQGIDDVESAIQDYPHVSVANYNSDEQVVVSGEQSMIQGLYETLQARKWSVMKLAVGGAFHSELMKDAAVDFRKALDTVSINGPSIPVVANLTAKPYPESADKIRDILSDQIYSPVRWTDTIRHIRSRAANDESVEFSEFGPKKILTGLQKNIC